MHVRTASALAATLLVTVTSAFASVDKLNASQVAYRTRSIAFINAGHGKFSQAALGDAALGAGDRVRYMIVATNQSELPQVAGVSVTIPDYTTYDPLPQGEADDADIIEWSADNKHWQSSHPKVKQRVRALRWVLADELGPKMSAAFVFELKLTGPYSDRTGDLNATRLPDAHPVEALTAVQAQQIRDQHVEQTKPAAASSLIDPLAFGLQAAKGSKTEWNGLELVELTRRLDVVYRASGSALVRGSDGSYSTLPLTDAHLGEGDKVRYTIVVRNEGQITQSAGASFTIPPYARYESVESKGDGIIEVTEDGTTWVPEAKLPKDRVRSVRWAYQGKLTPREVATFTVQMRVLTAPPSAAPGSLQNSPQSVFRALAPSTIQSVKFTNAVTSGTNASFSGLPLNSELSREVGRTVDPGVVRSDATPVPTATPDASASAAKAPASGLDPSAIGAIGAGIGLIVVVFLFMRARNGTAGGSGAKPKGRGVAYNPVPGAGAGGMIRRGRLTDDREQAERV